MLGRDIELSRSEFARKAIRVKVTKDRSRCLRTNKCVLDQYLMHDLGEDAIEDSTVLRLQMAGELLSHVSLCYND